MSRATQKATRLLQIEQLLWAHPEGLNRAEIARRLGVHRSTITKYLNQDQLPPCVYEDEDRRVLKVDRSADLTRTSFSLHEVMAIHLATRLLTTRTDKQNPHAASALRKLGQALQRLDRNVSNHLLRSADAMDELIAYKDPAYLDVLEKLTESWSTGRKVLLCYQRADGQVSKFSFHTYFIEPYAIGQTVHAIGLREPPGVLRTLKLERIRQATITQMAYTIPEEFEARSLLRNAWGIWYSADAPIEVILRFSPRVAARVTETRWHPSQILEEQADGHLLWRGRIAEPQEMMPWIRGWGADCEVLAPETLRQRLIDEVGQLIAVYEVK
jgi:CRISPR-associated endonuclease/helicase Cas3